MPAKIARYKELITNHKLQLRKSQITNYKMEGVNKKLTTNGNEGIKLIEAIEEAKDAEDAEEADEADVNKEEAKKRQIMPMKKPKMLQIMIGMKLGPESKCFVQ